MTREIQPLLKPPLYVNAVRYHGPVCAGSRVSFQGFPYRSLESKLQALLVSTKGLISVFLGVSQVPASVSGVHEIAIDLKFNARQRQNLDEEEGTFEVRDPKMNLMRPPRPRPERTAASILTIVQEELVTGRSFCRERNHDIEFRSGFIGLRDSEKLFTSP